MNAYLYNRPDNHPSISFLYLLITVFICAVVFSLIGLLLGIGLYGSEILGNISHGFDHLGEKELNFFSLSQIFSAIGTFILPAFLLNKIERNREPYFNLSFGHKPIAYFFVILIIFIYAPFFEWTILVNEQMRLPEFLAGLERWMRLKEDETSMLTNALLSRPSIGALIINIFMVGILAAVGEELLFRGCLQNIFIKWMGNSHLAIWLAAIIFSAIHLQFYGFLPRMLIGALCGYLYFLGKSIWFPITAHFINNASAIIIAFYLTKTGKPLDYFAYSMDQWPLFIISFLGGTGFLFFLKKYFRKS